MNTPSRREFLTYAAAATFASALPASAQTRPDQTKKGTMSEEQSNRPLVVDVVGPMAFRWCKSGFDVWMPQLDVNSHEAGIITPVKSFPVIKGDYKISGTQGSADNPPPIHQTGNSQIYQAGTSEASREYFIHISLPMPFNIVLLYPVPAKIWSRGNKPPDQNTDYAVGLRLLYPHAGKPALSALDGTALPPGAPKDGVIQFDPGPTKMLDMSITYSAYNAGDDDATDSFEALAKLLKLNLQIEFPKLEMDRTMQRPCKSPVIQLDVCTQR